MPDADKADGKKHQKKNMQGRMFLQSMYVNSLRVVMHAAKCKGELMQSHGSKFGQVCFFNVNGKPL